MCERKINWRKIVKESHTPHQQLNFVFRGKMQISIFFKIFLIGVVCSMIVYWIRIYLPHAGGHVRSFYMPKQSFLQVTDDVYVAPSLGTTDVDLKYKLLPKADPHNNANEQEALGSLNAAIEFKLLGKYEKALRLFEHAMALSPKHPEILTKYGEFLEHSQRDVITADLMYFQALSVNPQYGDAVANRRRTATIVELLDQERLNKLDEKRDALSGIHESNAALRRAKKEAYFQNIYHSVGIEGNTMTLAQTRSVIETRMAINGKSIDEHNEILGLDSAMKYINATLVNKNDQITTKDILEIHKRVLGHVDPIEGGEFRRTQVYVGGHIPPGPGDLAILMEHFEHWLNSERVLSMHPVKHAALAHYKLVHIHPFTDGNGRTSRLLMNTILMRAGYPPVIIPKQHRHNYYNYLQLANEGDIRPFVRFIADCTEKTLDLFLWATSDLPHQIPLLAQNDQTPIIHKIDDDSDESSSDSIRLKGAHL